MSESRAWQDRRGNGEGPPSAVPSEQSHAASRRGSSLRATVLAVLLWPACAAGAVVGALLAAIAGGLSGKADGWAALGWAFLGSIIGVAVGGLLLGWVWAIATRRRRLLPALATMVLPGAGAAIGFPLIIAVPGSSNDLLRIVACGVIVAAVTALVFLVGRTARPVPEPRNEPAVP